MTCIVGYIDKQNKMMYMGGDSAGVGDLSLRIRKDEKVFKKDEMLIGYTSSFRMGQLLRYKLEIPKCILNNIYEYMCTDFIDAVRKCLKENGYLSIKENNERIGTFLVAFKGKLFYIEDDLQVGEVAYNFNSCGCGEDYAMASLRTLDNYSEKVYDGLELVTTALKVAQDFSGGVREPFIIESLKY